MPKNMYTYPKVFAILKQDAEPQHKDIVIANEKICDSMAELLEHHVEILAMQTTAGAVRPNGKAENAFRKTIFASICLVVHGTIKAVDTSGLTEAQHTELQELLKRYTGVTDIDLD